MLRHFLRRCLSSSLPASSSSSCAAAAAAGGGAAASPCSFPIATSSLAHLHAPPFALWRPDPRHVLWSWPLLPITPFYQMGHQRMYASKLKKYKIKAYSSFKERFKTKANGEVKRWKAGKRHNAHSKTNKQLRQLRRPTVVHPAYATVMKKLNFMG